MDVMQKFLEGVVSFDVQYVTRAVQTAIEDASRGDPATLHEYLAIAYDDDPDDYALAVRAVLEAARVGR